MEERATLDIPDKDIKEITPSSATELLQHKFTLRRQVAKQRMGNTETNKKTHLKWGYKEKTCN